MDAKHDHASAAKAASRILDVVVASCRKALHEDAAAALGIETVLRKDALVRVHLPEIPKTRILLPRLQAKQLLHQRDNSCNPELTTTACRLLASVSLCEDEEDQHQCHVEVDTIPLIWAMVEYSNAEVFGWPAWLMSKKRAAVIRQVAADAITTA